MFILVNENNVVERIATTFVENEKQIILDEYVYLEKPTNFRVFEVSAIPEYVTLLKYCYEPAAGFFENPLLDQTLKEGHALRELAMSKRTPEERYFIASLEIESLDELKEAKINSLKESCTSAVNEGFVSNVTDASGVAYQFGFNSHDQSNFEKQMSKINLWFNLLNKGDMTQIEFDAKFPLKWKTKNAGVVDLTLSEFLQVTDDAEAHLMNKQTKYWTLEAQVISAASNADVDNIVW